MLTRSPYTFLVGIFSYSIFFSYFTVGFMVNRKKNHKTKTKILKYLEENLMEQWNILAGSSETHSKNIIKNGPNSNHE